MKEEKNKRIGYMFSLVFHIFLFFILITIGMFKGLDQPKTPKDVIYFTDAGNNGSNNNLQENSGSTPNQNSTAISVTSESSSVNNKSASDTYEKNINPNKNTSQSSNADSTNAGNSGGKNNGNSSGNGNNSGDQGNGNKQGNGASGDKNQMIAAIPPRVLKRTKLIYPKNLQNRGISGTIIIRAVIGTNGNIESAAIRKSSGSDKLDQIALSTFYQWIFAPGKNNKGNAIRCYVSQRFVFNLINHEKI